MRGTANTQTTTDIAPQGTRNALVALLVKILRPLVLLMLRHGMTAYEFTEISRWVFAQVAMDKHRFAVRDRHVWAMTKSRCAVLTGLTRRAVDELVARAEPPVDEARRAFHRGVRVMEAWRREPGYQDEHGQPRDVPVKGPRGSLEWLVRNYCRDIPIRAMFDDLLHRGCVERPERGVVRFVHADFDGPEVPVEDLEQLGQHAEHFVALLDRHFGEHCPLPGFTEVTAGPVAQEHQEAMRLRLAQAMATFTAQINRDLSASPKALTRGEDDATVVVGVYAGFI